MTWKISMARLALLALLLTSCATTRFIDAASEFAAGPSNEAAPSALAVAVVVIIPICLVWDVATFPVQIIGGYPPYGDGDGEHPEGGENQIEDVPSPEPEDVPLESGKEVLIKPETVGSASLDGARRGDVLVRFAAETSVVFLEEQAGFAHVRLPSGIGVWVSSDSIRR
jgi:hypothetical protein